MKYFLNIAIFVLPIAFLVSCGIQDSLTSSVELLEGKEVPANWIDAVTIRVSGVKDRTSIVQVGLVKRDADSGASCQLADARVQESEKWSPLPIRFFNPITREPKLNKTFNEALDFTSEEHSPEKMSFVSTFEKGAIKFSSFWQIRPYLAENKDKTTFCAVRAEICWGAETMDDCGKKWKWLKEIIGVPNVYDYYIRGIESLSDLTASFYEKKSDGTIAATGPVSLINEE